MSTGARGRGKKTTTHCGRIPRGPLVVVVVVVLFPLASHLWWGEGFLHYLQSLKWGGRRSKKPHFSKTPPKMAGVFCIPPFHSPFRGIRNGWKRNTEGPHHPSKKPTERALKTGLSPPGISSQRTPHIRGWNVPWNAWNGRFLMWV